MQKFYCAIGIMVLLPISILCTIQPGSNLWTAVQESSHNTQEIIDTINNTLQEVRYRADAIQVVTERVDRMTIDRLQELLRQLASLQFLQQNSIINVEELQEGGVIPITSKLDMILQSILDSQGIEDTILEIVATIEAIIVEGFCPPTSQCDALTSCCESLATKLDTVTIAIGDIADTVAIVDSDVLDGFRVLSAELQILQSCCASLLAKLDTVVNNTNDIIAMIATLDANILQDVAILISNINTLQECCTSLVNTVGTLTGDVGTILFDLNTLQTTVASDFDSVSTMQTSFFDALTGFEDAVLSALYELSTSDDLALSTIDGTLTSLVDTINALETTVANDATNTQASLGKIFSELDSLETSVIQTLSLLDDPSCSTLDGTIMGLTDAIGSLETTVANDATNTQASLGKIFSELDSLETSVMQTLSLLDDPSCSTLDGAIMGLADAIGSLETTVTSDFADTETSLTKIFSGLDEIEEILGVGVNALYEKLHTIEPKSEPFIISKQTIGNGDTFVIDFPGYYKLSDAITFNQGIAIQILASNVVLDLNGMCIDGTASTNGVCIAVISAQCVTIKNGSLLGTYGIIAQDSSNLVIKDIIGCHNIHGAFALLNVHQAVIQDCVVSHADEGNGLVVDKQSSEVLIQRCSMTSCMGCGYKLSGTNITLSSSVAQANGNAGILCSDLAKAQIIANNAEGNGADGIVLATSASNVHVLSNRILGNSLVGLNDMGATGTVCANNLSAGNGIDFAGVKAVALCKATSYWHNVYA